MCNELFGNRPRFIMFRRCFAPGPDRCNGQGAPSLLVRFHLNAPHVPQNSSVALSLTVHALMLCLPVACCVFEPEGVLPDVGGRGCGLLLAWGSFCFGCSMSLSLRFTLVMMTYCDAAHLAA